MKQTQFKIQNSKFKIKTPLEKYSITQYNPLYLIPVIIIVCILV